VKVSRLGAIVGLVVATSVAGLVPTAQAAAPALELPFLCGSSWRGDSGSSNAHLNHEIDFNMSGTTGNEDLGEPVLAAAAGTVRWEGGASSAYGNYLEIDHGDGYSTLYAHLDTKAVHLDATVRQGQLIGTVGNTDGNSPGISAHLHFEFRNRGSGQGYPDYIRPASFHGDPFDYATGVETYISQNCGASVHAAKSINGDRYDDAVGIDAAGVAWLYRGTTGGGFASATRIGPGWGTFSRVGIGDSDADGLADLWAVSGGTLLYWHNRGDITFSPAVEVGPGWSGIEYLSFADVNGDNRTDILARDGGNMYLYVGHGNGAFASRTLVSAGWAHLPRHTASDADADGDGDIWATGDDGRLYWERVGGTYATAVQVGSGWNAFRQPTSMDLNGDSLADLVAIRTSDGTLWRWFGTGSGTFGQGTEIGHGWTTHDLACH
jgi:hypothetical protein